MRAFLSFVLFSVLFAASSQDDFDRARTHFSNNNIDSARYYINREMQRNPRADDYFLSGLIHEAQGKDLRALADYEAVVKVDPRNLEAYFQKGLIYYNSASAEQAIKDFTHVISNHHRSSTNAVYYVNDPYGNKSTTMTSLQSMVARVHQYRGLAYQKIGDDQRALADFDRSFRYDTIADFYVNRSLLYSKLDNKPAAISDLRSALQLEPENYLAWYNLALLDTKAQLPTYLLNDEEFFPMLNLLGANAYEAEEYDLSIQYLTKAIENNPEEELAYINRGKSLMKKNSFRPARADFLKALRLNSTNIEVFYLMGNSFFYEGKYQDAIGFYERYLSVDQGYGNVWYNAAMAYLSSQEKDRGCVCLEKADRLGMAQAASQLRKYCVEEN